MPPTLGTAGGWVVVLQGGPRVVLRDDPSLPSARCWAGASRRLSAPLGARFGRSPVLVAGAVVAGLAALGSGLTAHGLVAAALMAAGAVGVMFWNVLSMSLRQAMIPAELFGRVQGGYRTLVWGAIPVGALLGGLLADATTVPTVFVAAGCAELAVAAALWRLLAVHRDAVRSALAAGDSPASADRTDP